MAGPPALPRRRRGLAGPEPSSRSGAAQGWNAALCGSAKCGARGCLLWGEVRADLARQRSCGLAGAQGAQRCPGPAEQQSGLVCKAPSRTAGSAIAGKPNWQCFPFLLHFPARRGALVLVSHSWTLSLPCLVGVGVERYLQCPGSEDTRLHTCLVSVPSLLQLPWVTLLPVSGAA